jgi:hypothetical protein
MVLLEKNPWSLGVTKPLQCTAGAPFKDHNTKPVLISCASVKMYSHGGFDRCSGCTLELPSTEIFPLQ